MENWRLTWTKTTSFSKTSVDALLDNISGVYRLSYEADDGNYYIFYIGQAEDVKRRLSEHLSDGEKNVCIGNYLRKKNCFFRYAEVTKEYIRKAAEKQMYKQYEPVCNDKEPEGREDVRVNLN